MTNKTNEVDHPRVSKSFSDVLGDNKALLQRLHSIEKTLDTINRQLGVYDDQNNDRVNNYTAINLLHDFVLVNQYSLSSICEIERLLGNVCDSLGDAYIFNTECQEGL